MGGRTHNLLRRLRRLNGEEKRMRAILIAALFGAGIGLALTSGGSAAPINGTVIKDAAATSGAVTDVGYRYRHHCRYRSVWRRYC
jgi:hypothetical protein